MDLQQRDDLQPRHSTRDGCGGAEAMQAGQPKDQAAIQAWLVAEIAERLEIDPADIDARRPFTQYGLDSAEAVSLAADLGEWLGRSLAPTLAWDHPSIAALARHLAGEDAADAATPAPKTH